MEPATCSTLYRIKFRRGTRNQPAKASAQTGSARSRPSGALAESKGSSTGVDDCGGESDASSDAGTRRDVCERSEGSEEAAVAELLGGDGARKKMEVLAAMVGMVGEENDEPGAVLGEVVRAIRELQRKAEHVGWRSGSRGDRKQ